MPSLTRLIRPAAPAARRMKLVLATTATLCLGGLATGVGPALATFPGANGRIAFDSFRDGDDVDVWTMSPDGSDPVNLTADSASSDERASWRPDGRKLVFQSDRETPDNPTPPGFPGPDREIFVMNPDGSNPTQLTFNELDDEVPAWSPDGKRIIFNRDFDPVRGPSDYDILTMKANGTRERNLTNSRRVDEVDADWSPDGRRIAFARFRDTDAAIYTMTPEGTRVRQVTFNDGSLDVEPNWSPNGRKIVFTSDRDTVEETPFQAEIYTMRADGRDQTRLTFDDLSDVLPVWSPDGRKIAFTSFRDPNGESEIYTMRTDGSQLVNLTQDIAFDFAPDWQPLDDHHGDDDDHDHDHDHDGRH